MGIPFSKQINHAFDQVTPLVASAYEVLETTKNIAIFITALQIAIVALLFLNLLALLGLLYSLNPDLETERTQLVTPAMQWIAGWSYTIADCRYLILGVFLFSTALISGAYVFYVYSVKNSIDPLRQPVEEDKTEDEQKESDPTNDADGQEVELGAEAP